MTSKIAILVIAGAFGAFAGLAGVTSAQNSAPAKDAAAAARGAQAWADNCASCHDARSPLEKSDRQWATAVTHMRVRANIPGNVANDILVFLQASNGARSSPGPAAAADSGTTAALPAVAAGDAERGARIFGETCVACHGANGKGAIPGVPDLAERLKKQDDVLLRHIIEGFESPGSPMPMPAKGGNPDLSDQDMADSLAYIRKNFSR